MLGARDDQEFNDKYEVHTLRDVIKEIKDENARTYLETRLPYTLTIHDALTEPAHLQRVLAFAKETGDYASLSATDLKVIALGIELAGSAGEADRVQKEPRALSEFRPKRFEEEYKRVIEEEGEEESNSEEDSDEDAVEAEQEPKQRARKPKNPPEGQGFDDGFQAVTQKKHGDKRNHIKVKAPPKEEEVEEKAVFVPQETIA